MLRALPHITIVVLTLAGCAPTRWQPSGREAYAEWAARDSAAARALFRALKANDRRFLTVEDYGMTPIGLYTPEHEAAIARFGSRMMSESNPDDRRVKRDREVVGGRRDFYHHAEYYNQALFNFVSATPAEQACFLSQSSAFGHCTWTPFPPSLRPPPERPEASLAPAERASILDAVLIDAIKDAGPGVVGLKAPLGWDGIYRPARAGRHNPTWLRSVLTRRLVSCLVGDSRDSACPKRGVVTTIRLGVPRRVGPDSLAVHVSVDTHDLDQPAATCGWGCYFGHDYDAYVERGSDGWIVRRDMMLMIN